MQGRSRRSRCVDFSVLTVAALFLFGAAQLSANDGQSRSPEQEAKVTFLRLWNQHANQGDHAQVEETAVSAYLTLRQPDLIYATGTYYAMLGRYDQAFKWYKVAALLGHGNGARRAAGWSRVLPDYGFDAESLTQEARSTVAAIAARE